jgi:hypothetical protein
VLGKLQLSPNPAHEMLFVSELPTEGRLEIVDFNGKLMQAERLSAGSHAVNLSEIPGGVYLVRFFGKGEIWSEKLVVER